MIIQWGIASAGKISHDFVTALGTLSDNEHSVIAIAARDNKRAQTFAALHKIPRSYGSYEELANDADVDIVYVGSIHPRHYDICMLMINNGKHVLCEKPLCMNEKQCHKLIMHAERKKLFLMEAVWSRFFPAYRYVRRQIETGMLGDIKEIEVSFGSNLENVERMRKKSLGGGTVLDLGIYTIQLSQWILQEPPKKIKATGELNDDNVDLVMEADLIYSNGVISKIRTSAKTNLPNIAVIKGTKGQITLKDFWAPTTLIDIDSTEKTWALPEGKHKTNFINSIGLRYEAEEARECLLANKLQSEIMSHNESLLLAKIEDEIRKQIGVCYVEDENF